MPRLKQPHKVSLLTTGLARGGAEKQVVLLATGLRKRGWTVSVESLLPPQAFVEELSACGVPVLSLGMHRGIPDPRAIWRLSRRWQCFRPDVVHCHMVHANLLGRITRLMAPPKVLISTAHSIWEGPRWRDWAYRLTEPLTDLTTNVSQMALARYVADGLVGRDKAAFVPNGVDLSRFLPDAGLRSEKRHELGWGGRFVWLAVGNLRVPKDYPNLLDAFAHHCRESQATHLAIAGNGDLLSMLSQKSRDLRIHDRVTFLGAREDVAELMQAADCFVMSSEWEGLPLALIEAAASALPTIATSVGGNGEVVADGVTGFLVPPKDSEALSAAMSRMLHLTDSQRQQLGAAGRNRAEALYGIENILSRWENIYVQLLQARGSRRANSWIRSWGFTQGARPWLRD
ncbi:MAG: glycosyltransferase [Bryobacterales bacterium]|nr:glycosyltransferase [Bryobacterales bacterium]